MIPGLRLCEDRILALVLICGSLAYGFAALDMPGTNSGDTLGAAGLPLIIAGAGVLLGIWLFFEPGKGEDAPEGPKLRAGIFWCLILAYCLALPFVGFGASTFVFLCLAFLLLEARPVWAGVIAIVTTLSLWLLFVQALSLRLPAGPWG